MKKSKILLIIENIGSGGAERQMCGLAVALTQAGYQCRLISYERRQFYEQYLRDNRVDYQLLPELLNKKTRVFKLVAYLWKYKPNFVISFNESVNVTTSISKFFYPCKLIVSERNNNMSISLKDRLRFNLYRIADVIVPNSFSQGNFIKKNFPFLSAKVNPIINFVDFNKFKPLDVKKEHDPLEIITVARFAPQKNCLLYLDAVKKIKDKKLKVHFTWIGSFKANPEYFNKFLEKYDLLQLNDILTIKDASDNVCKEYNDSDVFMLPSLYEGYPNVVIEAMSCKLPILCSNVFENPYIVKDNVNGLLFNPNDVEDIVNAIIKMSSLARDDRKQMGELNRKFCLDNNSYDDFIRSWEKLLK